MNIPGFTADAAVYRSQSQYRINFSFGEHVKLITLQLEDDRVCYSPLCLQQCRNKKPPFGRLIDQFPDATCYDFCQISCPRKPPEIIF
jgi:hypothetical protein